VRTRAAGFEPTPVEVWAPAFAWFARPLTPETIFSTFGRCRLCELDDVESRDRRAHARQHQRERNEWAARRARANRAEAKRTLRVVNAEKKLEREVLG
jgi:hypothetical protein